MKKVDSIFDTSIFNSAEELSEYALREWHKVGCSAIRTKGQFFAALSGGKTPGMVYDAICKRDTLNDYGRVVLFQVDERYVDRNSELSNFKMIVESFDDCRWMNSELLISIPVSSKNPRKDAENYDSKMKKVKGLYVYDIPIFDLIFLGMGEDGHTASLFSHCSDLYEQRNVCETIDKDGLERITLSLKVLRNAENIILIATGKKKAKAVECLVKGLDKNLPAYVAATGGSKVQLLLDFESAALIDN